MSNLHRIKNYLLENNFEIRIYEDNVYVSNFDDIGHFDSYKIIIKKNNKSISIEGSDLVVSKLLKSEILVTGNINKIEFR